MLESPFDFRNALSGIESTNTISGEELDNFLSSDPDNIKPASTPATPSVKKDETPVKDKVTVETDPKTVIESKQELDKSELDEFLDDGEDKKEVDEEGNDDNKADDNKPDDDNKEDVNLYEVFSEDLFNLGKFTKDDGEEDVKISTPEEFVERFDREVYKHAENYLQQFLSRFGPDKVEFFENVFVSGIEPEDYFQRYSAIKDISSIDLTEETNQEKIVRELLRSEKRSTEYINKKIQRLKDYSDLEEEATEAKAILVKREQDALVETTAKKQQEIARKEANKKQYTSEVARILNEKITTKDFDGIPVDQAFASEVNKMLTNEGFQLNDGTRITEFDKEILELQKPENFPMKVKLAMLLKMLKTDPTLSKFKKKAVSTDNKEAFQAVKKAGIKSTSKKEDNTNKQQSSAWSWTK